MTKFNLVWSCKQVKCALYLSLISCFIWKDLEIVQIYDKIVTLLYSYFTATAAYSNCTYLV